MSDDELEELIAHERKFLAGLLNEKVRLTSECPDCWTNRNEKVKGLPLKLEKETHAFTPNFSCPSCNRVWKYTLLKKNMTLAEKRSLVKLFEKKKSRKPKKNSETQKKAENPVEILDRIFG